MATTYLTRTPSGSGSQRKFTFSFWVKRSGLSSQQHIFTQYSGSLGDRQFRIEFQANDTMRIYNTDGGTDWILFVTNRVFRDSSAWMHIVVAIDTTQSTESNRVKIYINGSQETSFSTSTYPSLNRDLDINTTAAQVIGALSSSSVSSYFDGSLTHFHFIDNTQYQASDFGETDSTSGIWKPKTAPSVTYGTNGFFLKFENSGAMGTDSSGNSNTFTVSGTLTQNVDTPSNNFATWNANKKLTITLSNGNTTTSGNGDNGVWSTIGNNSGKWYWETQQNANGTMMGIVNEDVTQTTSRSENAGVYGVQNGNGSYAYYRNNGSNGQSSGFPELTTSNVVCHALDLDNGKYFIGVDGVFKNLSGTTSNLGTGADPTFTGLDTTKFWFPFTECRGNGAGCDANFGNGYFGTTAVASAGTAPSEGGIFEFDCPNGYQALCTKGINSF